MAVGSVPSLKGERVSVDPSVVSSTDGTAQGLAARFLVQNLLGEGGMGSVFVAQDRGLGRVVALKRLREGLEADADAMRRFILEAQIGAQLEHPNIVPLYSFERSQNGAPAIAMQLLEGRTMAQYINDAAAAPREARGMRGEYSLKERLGTLLGVCEAIHFAHERGVIHRDLKPDNVMLGRFREVYVMDWGLARVTSVDGTVADPSGEPRPATPLVAAEAKVHSELSNSATIAISSSNGAESATATRQGDVMGTPQYMPPEQALGMLHRVGPATDQFALGVMLQELATLLPARSHSSITVALSEAVLGKLAPPVDAEGVPVHAALQAIVARATRREPNERYASVNELANDIRRFVRDEPVSVYPEGLARRTVRAAARRPVLSMAVLSLCGLLASVAIIAGVVRDARQTKRQAAVLENTRRVLVAVTDRAHVVDVELSDRAADVQAVGAATAELLDRDVARASAKTPTVPTLAPSAAYAGVATSFDDIAVFWPGREKRVPAPDSAQKVERLAPWLRRTLVDALPAEDRDGGIPTQERGLRAGHSDLMRAFVGLEDGTFAQFPAIDIAAHDPRERPWYKNGSADQTLHWTRPIADVEKRTVRITAVLGMRSHGDFIGVAGADMRVSALAQKLALELPGFQRAYLVTEDGKIAVSESLEREMLAVAGDVYRDLPLPQVNVPELQARITRGERGGYVTSGARLVVFARLISPPWTYVAEFDRTTYLGP